ncbi:hypothetical protein SESBI_13094 [Sesbania bispinosa]|nr:hypothetical protein SESBI_13094 [Sesbania bispinosa]
MAGSSRLSSASSKRYGCGDEVVIFTAGSRAIPPACYRNRSLPSAQEQRCAKSINISSVTLFSNFSSASSMSSVTAPASTIFILFLPKGHKPTKELTMPFIIYTGN